MCTSILILMLTLTMSHNSNTKPAPPPPPPPAPLPPPPLPLYSSELVGAFICKAQNYCRKCCIHTVCYFSNWYYFLLPYTREIWK